MKYDVFSICGTLIDNIDFPLFRKMMEDEIKEIAVDPRIPNDAAQSLFSSWRKASKTNFLKVPQTDPDGMSFEEKCYRHQFFHIVLSHLWEKYEVLQGVMQNYLKKNRPLNNPLYKDYKRLGDVIEGNFLSVKSLAHDVVPIRDYYVYYVLKQYYEVWKEIQSREKRLFQETYEKRITAWWDKFRPHRMLDDQYKKKPKPKRQWQDNLGRAIKPLRLPKNKYETMRFNDGDPPITFEDAESEEARPLKTTRKKTPPMEDFYPDAEDVEEEAEEVEDDRRNAKNSPPKGSRQRLPVRSPSKPASKNRKASEDLEDDEDAPPKKKHALATPNGLEDDEEIIAISTF